MILLLACAGTSVDSSPLPPASGPEIAQVSLICTGGDHAWSFLTAPAGGRLELLLGDALAVPQPDDVAPDGSWQLWSLELDWPTEIALACSDVGTFELHLDGESGEALDCAQGTVSAWSSC